MCFIGVGITVRIEDAAGQLCPITDNIVRFTVGGARTLAAADDGDPATLAPLPAAFRRRARLIVRSTGGEAGTVRIEATSAGLAAAAAEIMTTTQH